MTSTATYSNGASKLPPILRMVRAKDLHLEHTFWSNPRTVTDLGEKEIAELAADIRLRGIQVPLNVLKVATPMGGHVDLVLEGQRRTLAALAIDPNLLVPVVDKSPEPVDLTWEISDRLLLDMLAIGVERSALSDYELSEVAERMRNRGKSLEDIGTAIKRSESWVSRILTARGAASPKLLLQWRKGQVTTESFKALAAEKDVGKQEEQTARVVEAGKSGNKGEARALAKEAELRAKAEAKPAPAKPAKVAPVVKGPQLDLIEGGKKTDAPAKPARKPGPSRAALEDIVAMASKRPPTAPLAQGIVLGIRYALGDIEPDGFGKAWQAYINRVHGIAVAKQAKNAREGLRLASGAKSRKAKAKARKPVKKSSAKKAKR